MGGDDTTEREINEGRGLNPPRPHGRGLARCEGSVEF